MNVEKERERRRLGCLYVGFCIWDEKVSDLVTFESGLRNQGLAATVSVVFWHSVLRRAFSRRQIPTPESFRKSKEGAAHEFWCVLINEDAYLLPCPANRSEFSGLEGFEVVPSIFSPKDLGECLPTILVWNSKDERWEIGENGRGLLRAASELHAAEQGNAVIDDHALKLQRVALLQLLSQVATRGLETVVPAESVTEPTASPSAETPSPEEIASLVSTPFADHATTTPEFDCEHLRAFVAESYMDILRKRGTAARDQLLRENLRDLVDSKLTHSDHSNDQYECEVMPARLYGDSRWFEELRLKIEEPIKYWLVRISLILTGKKIVLLLPSPSLLMETQDLPPEFPARIDPAERAVTIERVTPAIVVSASLQYPLWAISRPGGIDLSVIYPLEAPADVEAIPSGSISFYAGLCAFESVCAFGLNFLPEEWSAYFNVGSMGINRLVYGSVIVTLFVSIISLIIAVKRDGEGRSTAIWAIVVALAVGAAEAFG